MYTTFPRPAEPQPISLSLTSENTVVIGEADSYPIMISAIWPNTSYDLLGQYYLIQEVKTCWHLETMPRIDLVLSDFDALF